MKASDPRSGRHPGRDLIVIGAGPAGLSAAISGARTGLKVLVIGEAFGGTLNLTDRIENYPGFASVSGRELSQKLEDHARGYGVDLLIDRVDNLVSSEEGFRLAAGTKTFRSASVVLATGARPKKLGVPGEERLSGKGVSYCALCDAPSFRGKKIVLAGGGESAVKEAVYAAEHAEKIFLINDEKRLRPAGGVRAQLDKLVAAGRVEVINGNGIREIEGKNKVTGVFLKKPHREKRGLEVAGVLIYIGVAPNSGLGREVKAEISDRGEIMVNRRCETSVPGCYAAGDVTDGGWRQAIAAAYQGSVAGWEAFNYCRRSERTRAGLE